MNEVLSGRISLRLVHEMPEAKSAVARAGGKSSQALVFLELLSFLVALQTYLEVWIYLLDIVNGSVVRVKRSHHCCLLHFSVVPEDYHVIAVNSKESLS